MRETSRRMLLRLGLTGKFLVHVGWILALSLSIMVGVTYLRARSTIRDELRKTEIVRIERWARRNIEAIHGVDRWKIAEALSDLGRDPFVVYAGFFDISGRSVAHQGDENAHDQAHRLDLLVPLRSEPASSGEAADSVSAPLPGTVPDPRSAARAVPLQERFQRALEGTGDTPESLLGWVEVTLATEPLDALLEGVVAQLIVVALLLLGVGAL